MEFEAKLAGIALKPKNNNDLYKLLRLEDKMISHIFDLRDIEKLEKVIIDFKPDFIFHLAAQSLVKKSYIFPTDTFESNAIGTLNLLNSLKELEIKRRCNIILITSDKSYKNLELERGYHENDILGGLDPYSASKGCAELIIKSYFNSYFKKKLMKSY